MTDEELNAWEHHPLAEYARTLRDDNERLRKEQEEHKYNPQHVVLPEGLMHALGQVQAAHTTWVNAMTEIAGGYQHGKDVLDSLERLQEAMQHALTLMALPRPETTAERVEHIEEMVERLARRLL